MAAPDVNMSGPRIKVVLDAVTAARHGLTTHNVGHLLGVSERNAKRVLGAMRYAKMIVLAGAGPTAVWCTPKRRSAVEEHILEVRAVKRAGYRKSAKERRKYTPMDGDTPIIRRVVQVWAPIKQAPGVVSIFQLGAL